ncbi:MAG: transposase, partial [Pseudomonadota bacterium]
RRKVDDRIRGRWPKLAELTDESEHDVLAHMAFRRQYRTDFTARTTERLNREVKRRTDVLGIFLTTPSIMRLIRAVIFEQIDEWRTASRSRQVEPSARNDAGETDPVLRIRAAGS